MTMLKRAATAFTALCLAIPAIAAAKDRPRKRHTRARVVPVPPMAPIARIQRLPDQRLRGRIAKPSVVFWLPRNFTAPTGLMSTSVWMPKRSKRRRF